MQNVFAMGVMVITVLWTITRGKRGWTQEDEEKKELGGRLDAFVLYVHSTVNLTF